MNAGVPLQGKKKPSNEHVPLGGQVSFNPSILMDGYIRNAFQNLTQVMSTQYQVVTTQDQYMMSEANREIGTSVNLYNGFAFERLHKNESSNVLCVKV